MQNAVTRIKAAIENRPCYPLARGELWLGTELLKRAGFTDTLENHMHLVAQLGQDMICLPVTDDISDKPALGYRYFKCADLRDATRGGERFVAAVVDGPFQELVNRMGLMTVLTTWGRKRGEMVRAYEMEQAKTLDLIHGCLDQGIHAVVIADDLAWDRGPLISPADIEMLCGPFYVRAVRAVHAANASAFLHSCGNITPLIPLIKAWRLNGLAAVQHGANDLVSLHRALGSQLTLMGGIEADLLEAAPSPGALSELERIVVSLAPSGGLILSSSCGLYRGDFLSRIERIYSIADRFAVRSSRGGGHGAGTGLADSSVR